MRRKYGLIPFSKRMGSFILLVKNGRRGLKYESMDGYADKI